MTIWRGEGGGGDATTDSEINFITSLTNSIVADTALTTANAAASAASALAAATSESNAAASEITAASSASAASASAISADASANSAANSYDSFDDRYLGSKTVAPTLDNDGNALLIGALYWNSVTTKLFVWSGTAWRDGFFTGLSSSLVTATAGQTVVTTPTYVVGTNTIQVYVNGLKVILGTDFTETSTTSITFSSGLTLGDEVEIVVVQSLTIGTAAASNVSYTPTGTVAATNVQNALSEIVSDLTASTGSSLVGYLPSGTGAVATTVQGKLREIVSVKDFGAVGDGVADDTAAIQAAINSFASGNGRVVIPAGTYKVTSTITVAQNRIHLVGAGSWATQLMFAPTENGTCLKLSKGASVLFQGSVAGICFYSNDSTYTKSALEIVDVSGYNIEDIVVGGSVVSGGSTFWSGGAGSRGLLVKGREAIRVNRLYAYADKPLEIATNPNFSISIDHSCFSNFYLGANNFPCVTINDGVNLTNVTFDGYQIWVLGTHGLYWLDTTTVGVSQTLSLFNVRTEQGTSSSAYSVYIAHNYNLQSLKLENCQLDTARNGVYLRKVERSSIYNVIDTSTSGTHTIFNADSTVKEIDIRNCYWNTGAVASLTGQNVVFSTQGPVASALPSTALYTSVTNPMTASRAANAGYEITLTNGDVASLGPITTAGMLTIVDSEYFSAIFNLRGTNAAVSTVSAPVGVYLTTAGTVGYTNVYWSAGNNSYEIQNLRGVTRRYKIVLNGTYASF